MADVRDVTQLPSRTENGTELPPCTCNPAMLSHGINTLDCPRHGLAAFMRKAVVVR